jgi:LytS/YehU family sensor histidine kinase
MIIMTWGLDLVNDFKYGSTISLSGMTRLFNFTQLIYSLLTLLITHWVFKRYYSKRNKWPLVIAVICIIPAFILFRYGLEEMLIPALFNARNYNEGTSFLFYSLDNVYYAIIYIVLGFLIFMLDNQITIQKKQALLITQSREAELAFLRSQINPHFLFNTLNNIYALSYKNSPKTPEAILKLSGLMRYMLYEKQENIPLVKEWEYIQHFISLQQLRYDYPLALSVTIEGDPDNIRIPPYLLIPFIENAFKHGDLADEKNPLIIKLSIKESAWEFYVENKVASQQKDPEGGVGLENVQRRLALLYENRHHLQMEQKAEKFLIYLQINR